METLVIVVAAEDWTLRSIARALESPSHQLFIGEGRCLEISHAGSSAYVCAIDPNSDELFDDWPEGLIPAAPSSAFSVDYRDPSLAESIVRMIADTVAIVVDTNFGEVLPGDMFIEQIERADRRWAWWRWPDEVDGSSDS